MARNKYPQETVDAILDASLQLFLEKGYDSTSIQDIVSHLGGLTKGAIYHHFSSKEDIFQAVCGRISLQSVSYYEQLRDNRTINGFEKLRLFCAPQNNPNYRAIWGLTVPLMREPRFFMETVLGIFSVTVPTYIQPVIEEGIRDGSIVTESPQELAQVITVLFNLWINPLVSLPNREEMERKIRFLDKLLRGIGLALLDEELINQFLTLGDMTKT